MIDGAAIARGVLDRVAEETRALASKGVIPGLAVVLVGEDPASQSYVASKGKAAKTCGFNSIQHTLPRETSEAELLALVDLLNADAAVHGILVQLPLPKGIDSPRVLEAIAPHKDVDGFHPFNVGLLSIGEMRRAMVPCTPAGVMILVDKACEILGQTLPGKVAVIVGRSNIVGKPMAALLIAADATVTVCHSKTRDLPDVVGRAEIVVAAVGRPEMIKGAWIRPGAVVIDVGMNRMPNGKLLGDVEFAAAAERAAAITPVPGGVGPMTIAMLLANTLLAARVRAGVAAAAAT